MAFGVRLIGATFTSGGLGVVATRDGVELGPAVPKDIVARDRTERFGRLAQMCFKLEAASRRVAEPCGMNEWRARLGGLLTDLTLVEGREASLRVQVEEKLLELLPEGDDCGPT